MCTYVRNDTVAYHYVGAKDLNLATPKIPSRTNYLMCPVCPKRMHQPPFHMRTVNLDLNPDLNPD